jgi:hypothetical protein
VDGEASSGETSTAYISERKAWISRTVRPRAERDDSVIESRKASLAFADQPRLERTAAIAWNIEGQRTVILSGGRRRWAHLEFTP